LNAGDWCQFCSAKAKCPALKEASLKWARTEAEAAAVELTPDEDLIEAHLSAKLYQMWYKAVEEYLYEKAMAGNKLPGLKLVHGKSRRYWKDEDAAMESLDSIGYVKSDYAKTKLRGISDIEGLMSKDQFESTMNPHIGKKESAPKLVSADADGIEYNTAASAAADFED